MQWAAELPISGDVRQFVFGIMVVSSARATPIAQHQLDHCYGACTGCQSGSGSISNSPNLSGDLFSTARLPCWSDQPISLVRCGRPHRSFCQFRRTTWTLLLVVSLLLLQDSGPLFLWTVELLHQLTHLRPGLRHFSLLRHNRHCSTRLCTTARYKCIDWLIDDRVRRDTGHRKCWNTVPSTRGRRTSGPSVWRCTFCSPVGCRSAAIPPATSTKTTPSPWWDAASISVLLGLRDLSVCPSPSSNCFEVCCTTSPRSAAVTTTLEY